ncbi:NUDIX domain-containing protein [Kineococcus gynurae]|uniref:NUDIX domain-containing protein n=1 Tax=Kineococcus gynurae TaxID=452979 RepID=A0ABV5LPK0_9ACTN
MTVTSAAPTRSATDAPRPEIEAAGCLVVRPGPGGPEFLLVHRPTTVNHQRDWSWPKGKLDGGEAPPAAAVRETWEETGLRPRLSLPLPERRYRVADGRSKRIRYWLAFAADDDTATTPAPDEVDDVEWLTAAAARERLSYAHDVELLDDALAELDRLGEGVPTWPLIVLRHAKAMSRSDFRGGEAERPLLDRGHEESHRLAPLLACWDVRGVRTSPWARCVQTVLPAADLNDWPVHEDPALTEAAHAEDPRGWHAALEEVYERADGVVLCTHGPLLPDLQARLADLSPVSAAAVLEAKLGKGEFVVAHVVGQGPQARVAAVERHDA